MTTDEIRKLITPSTYWDGERHVECYVCVFCGSSFPKPEQLREHLEAEHAVGWALPA